MKLFVGGQANVGKGFGAFIAFCLVGVVIAWGATIVAVILCAVGLLLLASIVWGVTAYLHDKAENLRENIEERKQDGS